jgi:thioredoxin 1
MKFKFGHHEPSRTDVDSLAGPAMIEFGTSWCGYCRAAQAPIATALADHPGVRHLKIEDGSGRPLGRSFGVKLWPTLVFLSDGKEVARLVRPRDSQSIASVLAKIDVGR